MRRRQAGTAGTAASTTAHVQSITRPQWRWAPPPTSRDAKNNHPKLLHFLDAWQPINSGKATPSRRGVQIQRLEFSGNFTAALMAAGLPGCQSAHLLICHLSPVASRHPGRAAFALLSHCVRAGCLPCAHTPVLHDWPCCGAAREKKKGLKALRAEAQIDP